jgi:predicted nucleic acid-binding protein
MIVVSDSSPLICFAILGQLEIFDYIFSDFIVPQAVFDEISISDKPFSDSLASYLRNKVRPVKNDIAVKILNAEIDLGESEAIVLALESDISNVLMDDFKGRRAASANGLIPIGTVGALIRAKQMNLIHEIKPLLDLLLKNKIRISDALYHKALALAEED